MLPASNRGVGMNIGFPDVCNTIVGPATVPIPYPNIALTAQAAPFSVTVKVSMMNALNMASKIPMTSGDEAGTAHPTIKGMGSYTMGNPVVFVENLPAINLTCPTTGNNMNDALGAVLVPSAVNVFYTLRGPLYPPSELSPGSGPAAPGASGYAGYAGYDRALGASEIVALGEAARGRGEAPPGGLLEGGVGHIPVALFTADISAQIWNEVRRLEALGMRALLLDLRGSPGGDMDAAVRLAGDFLPEGAVIARQIDADGDAIVHRASHDDPYTFPLVILVDRCTASAAELFAASMQSERRAVIVGEATYGKGSAQRVLPALFAEGVVCATVASFTRPDGEPVEGAGVEPDLEASSEQGADIEAARLLAIAMLDGG